MYRITIVMNIADLRDASGGLDKLLNDLQEKPIPYCSTTRTKSGNGAAAVMIEDLERVLDHDKCPVCQIQSKAEIDGGEKLLDALYTH
jgi:hypothetical protein